MNILNVMEFLRPAPTAPRRHHEAYAHHFHYFWMPCPLCKEPFGGHECVSSGQCMSLCSPEETLKVYGSLTRGGCVGNLICPTCTSLERSPDVDTARIPSILPVNDERIKHAISQLQATCAKHDVICQAHYTPDNYTGKDYASQWHLELHAIGTGRRLDGDCHLDTMDVSPAVYSFGDAVEWFFG